MKFKRIISLNYKKSLTLRRRGLGVVTFFLLTLLLLSVASTAYGATSGLLKGIECDGLNQRKCTICDFLQLFVNGADIMVGLSGTFAILMFIYGGITWITSYGNESRVKQGRDIIMATVTGIVIVLMAWTIINLIIGSIAGVDNKINWSVNANGMCAT